MYTRVPTKHVEAASNQFCNLDKLNKTESWSYFKTSCLNSKNCIRSPQLVVIFEFQQQKRRGDPIKLKEVIESVPSTTILLHDGYLVLTYEELND
jgi:uncharacterized protein (DUF1499 family)